MTQTPNPIRLITLDLDDTVWDSRQALVAAEHAVYAVLAEQCPRITAALEPEDMVAHRRDIMERRPELAHDFTRLRIAALEALALEHGYGPAVVEAAMAAFFQHRNTVVVYPDSEAVLAMLSQRFELVAVTNGNADVAAIGLGHYFSYAVSPAESGAAKPDPGMFRYVLERSGVAPGQVLHVGDEPHTDILGAWRAGIAGVWVNRYGRQWPTLDARPHAEITSLEALPGVLAAFE